MCRMTCSWYEWHYSVIAVVSLQPKQTLWVWISEHNICRWADKFCLHCNIFIYIKHIWIKPFLCCRMVSLFHHTSPWTHRYLQSSHSAHRNGRLFRRSVQTAFWYWILNRGKSSSNWNSQSNASRLWWSVCWCEYSKMLGRAVQRWRTWASRFEWQNTKWKGCDCEWSASWRSRWRTDPWLFCRKIIMHLWK